MTDSLAVVLATHNPGKAREFQRLLGDSFALDLVPEWVAMAEETGRTFAENARLKAESVFAAMAGASAVLADDSGVEVDALFGRPGVLSARYAGESACDEDNVNKLLTDLHGQTARGARFVCALCLALPSRRPGGSRSPRTVEVRGVVEGTIAEAARGSGGFGYDPIFLPAGGDGTLAELPAAAKDQISHRGTAVKALLVRLRAEGLVSDGS